MIYNKKDKIYFNCFQMFNNILLFEFEGKDNEILFTEQRVFRVCKFRKRIISM